MYGPPSPAPPPPPRRRRFIRPAAFAPPPGGPPAPPHFPPLSTEQVEAAVMNVPLTCSAECFHMSRPNYETGAGFYAFFVGCLSGGENCVGSDGCRQCTTTQGVKGSCPSCVLIHFGLSPPPPPVPKPPPSPPPPLTPCPSPGCTKEIWHTQASNGQGSCGMQITWLHSVGHSSWLSACKFVGTQSTTPECAPCAPSAALVDEVTWR